MEIYAPVSPGELIDKITILEIKSKNISDTTKLSNVLYELQLLNLIWESSKYSKEDVSAHKQNLYEINKTLWDIEDKIREKEKNVSFDEEFIELARSVYKTNDSRSKVKKDLNLQLKSTIIEEKSYQPY